MPLFNRAKPQIYEYGISFPGITGLGGPNDSLFGLP